MALDDDMAGPGPAAPTAPAPAATGGGRLAVAPSWAEAAAPGQLPPASSGGEVGDGAAFALLSPGALSMGAGELGDLDRVSLGDGAALLDWSR